MNHRLLLSLSLLLGLAMAGCVGTADPPTSSSVVYGPVPRIGEIAPDFTQNDTSNHPVMLSGFRGKVVLIDFWASWCGPCLSAIPKFKDIWSRYRNRDFILLSVSLDNNLESWKRAIHSNNLDWYHTSDGKYWNNAVAVRYDVTGIPHAILLDKSGKVIAIDSFDYQLIEDALQ